MATEVQIDPNTALLCEIMGDEFSDHPRRILQIMDVDSDRMRRKWYQDLYGPLQPMTIAQLWEEMGAAPKFKKEKWKFFKKYFGTLEMYADSEHQKSIHGDEHMQRVPLYAFILGQYKGLSEEEMKVLLVAASVHDKARRDDRFAPNHGNDAAENLTSSKKYIIQEGDELKERIVPAYIHTYIARGMSFSAREIQQIERLCIYHEKSWEEVPESIDNRTRLLIQVLQAADAGDRFRSPSTRWWPQEQYFDEFFRDETNGLVNERAQEAFLKFTAYLTLTSEQNRFERNIPGEEAIKRKAQEVGAVRRTVREISAFRLSDYRYRTRSGTA